MKAGSSLRLALAVVVLSGIACAIIYAVAASLTATSAALGAGSAAVLPCDFNGVGVAFEIRMDEAEDNRWEVTRVDVLEVAVDCVGGSLNLVLVDADGVALARGGPVRVEADVVPVSVSPSPAADLVAAVHIAIVGP